MVTDLVKKLEDNILKITNSFHEEILTIRSSKPSASLVENISIEAYGSASLLKHLASISIIMPNIIVIEPWDKSILSNIKKSIENSNLGFNPQMEGNEIRIYLPPLTKERKEELIKILNSKKEEFRIRIRKAREETLEELKDLFEQKEISEDEKFKAKEEIQKIIDKGNQKLDEYESIKVKEIMES